jgi:hypothetical protein
MDMHFASLDPSVYLSLTRSHGVCTSGCAITSIQAPWTGVIFQKLIVAKCSNLTFMEPEISLPLY